MSEWREQPDWLAWEDVGERTRQAFANLAGVPVDDVSLTVAAHVMAGMVAGSFPPGGRGANVVALRNEHQSALWPFLTLADRGYEIRLVDRDALGEAIDGNTALVAVSLVQSADGAVVDVSPLEDYDALLYVDATQAVGVLDSAWDRIDVMTVSGYKWVYGPRGMGFSVIRPQARDRIVPMLASWKAASEPWGDPYGPPRVLTATARQYDLSLPWLGAPAALASLKLLNEAGIDRVGGHCRELAASFAAGVGVTPTGSGIVAVDGVEEERVREAGLRCSVRDGRVRLAFGVYNDMDDVRTAIAVCARDT